MTSWKKSYSEFYLKLKEPFSPRLTALINTKEDIIVASPLSNPLMKHELYGIRRFKAGKLRILYALSTERVDLWENKISTTEIRFLYVGLRDNDTYNEAFRNIRK